MVASPISVWGSACVLLGVLWLHQQPQLPDPVHQLAAAVSAVALMLPGWALARARSDSVWRTVSLLAWLSGLTLAVGALCAQSAASRLEERLPVALEGRDLTVVGVVDELPIRTRTGVRGSFRVESCQPDCVINGRIQLHWALQRDAAPSSRSSLRSSVTDLEPMPAQRWRLTVRLKRPHAQHNPGAFDRELRWFQEGIAAVGNVRQAELLEDRVPGVLLAVERARHRLRNAMESAANRQQARETGILAALTMGDQAAISAAQWTLFNQTGVGHLMSISGLHITMLAALGGRLAGALWGSSGCARAGWPLRLPVQTVRLVVAVAVALGYALLAGWGIPAQRTCFMLTVAALLLISGRLASIVTAVALSALGIIVFDPWAPLAAGFWLSFGAVLGIVWACSGEHFGASRRLRALLAAVRTQWAATVALVPLGALFFGSVSVVGPLANAFAIPLVSGIITPAALLAAAMALIWPQGAGWLLYVSGELTAGLVSSLQWLAAWPGSVVYLPAPSPWALFIGTAGCLLLLAPAGVPRRVGGVFALLPLAMAPIASPPEREVRLAALDVGQGMAMVVQAAGRVLVYDTGPSLGPDADAGSRVIVPWLRSQGIRRIDALVVSHLDDDHSGGAASVISAMQPQWVASSLDPSHAMLRQAARHIACRRGDVWQWGTVEFEFLHPAQPPEPARGSATNARSCVLRIRTGQFRALLAGDIEAAQERRLLEILPADTLRADVLLAPHHGSLTSSTEAFLDAVSPRLALFQVAYRSRFGHPHPRVMARYTDRDIEVARSDADGAVLIHAKPDGHMTVTRSRASPARYWRVPPQ